MAISEGFRSGIAAGAGRFHGFGQAVQQISQGLMAQKQATEEAARFEQQRDLQERQYQEGLRQARVREERLAGAQELEKQKVFAAASPTMSPEQQSQFAQQLGISVPDVQATPPVTSTSPVTAPDDMTLVRPIQMLQVNPKSVNKKEVEEYNQAIQADEIVSQADPSDPKIKSLRSEVDGEIIKNSVKTLKRVRKIDARKTSMDDINSDLELLKAQRQKLAETAHRLSQASDEDLATGTVPGVALKRYGGWRNAKVGIQRDVEALEAEIEGLQELVAFRSKTDRGLQEMASKEMPNLISFIKKVGVSKVPDEIHDRFQFLDANLGKEFVNRLDESVSILLRETRDRGEAQRILDENRGRFGADQQTQDAVMGEILRFWDLTIKELPKNKADKGQS